MARLSVVQPSGATGASAPPWDAWIDSFSGGTDDARLDNALTYAAAQTYPPNLRWSNNLYAYSTYNRQPFDGLRLRGPDGQSNGEKSAPHSVCELHLTGFTGTWFNNAAGDLYDFSFRNASLYGGSGACAFGSATDADTWWTPNIRDVSFDNMKSVLGTQAQRMSLDGAIFDGFWNINSCYDGAVHIAGGDCNLWEAGMYIDAVPAYAGSGQYHVWFDYLTKSDVGPIFVTCEADYQGILVSGSTYNNAGTVSAPLTIRGARVEGHGPTRPCYGNNIRIEGGNVVLRDLWIAYGLKTPAFTGHPTPNPAGLIHQTAGYCRVEGVTMDRWSGGQAETDPLAYCKGGIMVVKDASVSGGGGAWTGTPRVQADTGGTVYYDYSVTPIGTGTLTHI